MRLNRSQKNVLRLLEKGARYTTAITRGGHVSELCAKGLVSMGLAKMMPVDPPLGSGRGWNGTTGQRVVITEAGLAAIRDLENLTKEKDDE